MKEETTADVLGAFKTWLEIIAEALDWEPSETKVTINVRYANGDIKQEYPVSLQELFERADKVLKS